MGRSGIRRILNLWSLSGRSEDDVWEEAVTHSAEMRYF